ncbi:hypothetical protein EHJ10_12230 [Cronobacter dublinensis]|nr:hypothetical protein [Cronobacter dublinensis]
MDSAWWVWVGGWYGVVDGMGWWMVWVGGWYGLVGALRLPTLQSIIHNLPSRRVGKRSAPAV